MKRDPIMVLRMQMQEAGEIDDAGMTKLDEEIKAIVQDAWDFAEKSPEPPLEIAVRGRVSGNDNLEPGAKSESRSVSDLALGSGLHSDNGNRHV